MKLYKNIGCMKYVSYFVIWIGGTILLGYALERDLDLKVILIVLGMCLFFSMARIAYIEHLLEEVERRLTRRALDGAYSRPLKKFESTEVLTVCPKCGGWLKGGECENCTLP